MIISLHVRRSSVGGAQVRVVDGTQPMGEVRQAHIVDLLLMIHEYQNQRALLPGSLNQSRILESTSIY